MEGGFEGKGCVLLRRKVGTNMRTELTYAALSIHLHWVQNWIVTRGSLGSAASCLGSAIGSWRQTSCSLLSDSGGGRLFVCVALSGAFMMEPALARDVEKEEQLSPMAAGALHLGPASFSSRRGVRRNPLINLMSPDSPRRPDTGVHVLATDTFRRFTSPKRITHI